MKQPTTQALYGYWNDVRAGRLAPSRLEIEPSRIAAILSETFMLQRLDEGNYHYRLAGTRLCELFGSELRGRNFLDGWSKEDGAVLQDHLARICEQGAVAVLTFQGGEARHHLELEVILLPLLHTGRQISRILGAMSCLSASDWPQHAPIGRCRLLRREMIWPDGRPHSLLEKAGRVAPFVAKPSGGGVVNRMRRFRVLEGGRSNRDHDKR